MSGWKSSVKIGRRMEEEFYEEIELDKPFKSRWFEVREEDIISFAKEWNPEPYHIDKDAASKNKIGRIFACGPHLISICTKLLNEKRPRPATVAGLGWNELDFSTPAFGGDKLLVEAKALDKRLSKSKPEFGVVKYGLRLLNQNGEEVLTYTVSTMVECRR